MKRCFLLACCIGLTFSLFAQVKFLEDAHNYYQSSLFKEAIPIYERALEEQPHLKEAINNLAESYRYTNQPEKAAFWYQKAMKYQGGAVFQFQYAEMLKVLGKYDEAKRWFLKYAEIDPQKGKHFAASCDYAKSNIRASNAVFQAQMLEGVNSKSADFAPTFFGNQLLFASSRSVAIKKEGKVSWTNDAFNQYYSIQMDAQSEVLGAKPLRDFIGKDINDAPLSYTKYGDRVAITSNNFMDGIRHIAGSGMMMDIYLYDTKSMREWNHRSETFFTSNAALDSDTPFSTGHPYYTAKGDALYFASDRPGGFGGYDIYVSYKTSRGWTKPKNLGYPINTPGNEMTPFIDEFGRFYFSSDWHHGFGGMDIFTCERLAFGWGNVRNLGSSVNTAYDDAYFIIDAKKRVGYFSSNRPGGEGNEDIYIVKQFRNIDPRERQLADVGQKFVMNNIYYESGQATITNTNTKDFYDLLVQLHDNPDLIVQINSFTDARGSEKSNLELSQKRAKSLATFLESKGVKPDRIYYTGYGEGYLVNECTNGVNCSDKKHQENRRTEIYVIGKFSVEGQPVITFDARPSQKQFIEAIPVAKLVKNEDKNQRYIVPPSQYNNNRKTSKSSSKSSSGGNPSRQSHYAIGDQIEVANIYYEHNKSSIDEKNSPGLKELLKILEDHPHVVIEIGSHTDASGSSSYNKELSQKRASAVKKYLVRKGIDSDRLTAKGYGESKLLNRCKDGVKCSDEEHAENRRTEFNVIAQKGFKVGDIIKVEEISYELNSSKLDMKKSRGLAEIIEILEDNSISIEIRSHTDSKGSSKYNQELSEKRAKAIYDYLIKKGISRSRLKYKGYGETMLINHCEDGVKCSDEQHKQNRRTDFKVTNLK